MKEKKYDKLNIPRHVAIIMDGNGTWARRRGMPRNFGHRQGAKTLQEIVFLSSDIGIKYLTVFAFSTENWTRPKKEVDFLMNLPLEFLKTNEKEIKSENIRIICVGEKTRLPADLQKVISEYEDKTRDNKGLCLVIAISYGGRDDIVHAVNQLLISGEKSVNKETFSKYLYTNNLPDVDLMIRTSGQQRISNFLLWHLSYSELYFTKTLWPDFKEKEYIKALKDYSKRDRKFGGLH